MSRKRDTSGKHVYLSHIHTGDSEISGTLPRNWGILSLQSVSFHDPIQLGVSQRSEKFEVD